MGVRKFWRAGIEGISIVILLLLCGIPRVAVCQDASSPAEAAIGPGLWSGRLSLQPLQGQSGTFSADFEIRILAQDRGLLVDIPSQSMFGYPIDSWSLAQNRLSFVLDATGVGEELSFSGNWSAGFKPQGSTVAGGIVGTIRSRSWKGSFHLQRRVEETPSWERRIEIPVRGGSLPASLVLPQTASLPDDLEAKERTVVPLVVLVSGAGKTDRNGNNPDVPGRTDTLKQLALMLRSRGVATLRYDRRGTGEAYRMEAPGTSIRFDQHVQDLVAVIKKVLSLPREGRLILAGMNEGAWMAASALNRAQELSQLVDGIIALDAGGQSPMEALRSSLSEADASFRDKAMEIARYLVEKGELLPVPEDLADFFTPSRKDWLASWLAFDPVREFRILRVPVLFVRGEADLQVSGDAFGKLVSARPSSAAKIVPRMNYVLKEVNSEEENYAAFTDPSFPVPALLADLVAAYAKAQPAPAGLIDWVVF
mgnify:CR=1 FL=1